MSSPRGYVLTKPSFLTGNQQVDSLIYGTSWLSPDFGGDIFATRLTYSFIQPGQSYFTADYSPHNEFLNSFALTSAQQNAVTGALGAWSAVANVKFTLVNDNINTVGDLRFGGYWDMDDDAAAWAYFPDRTPAGGDVWIGPETNNAAPVKGTYDFMTFVHEIGHSLGLKHPFESSQSNSTLISPLLDDSHYTIMSYNNAYSYQPTTPMLLDIIAIQKIYGANMLWQTGDNVYRWAPDQSVFETIWDAGGNDTIDASNQQAAVRLNLNEGEFSNIGKAFIDIANLELINDGLAIAFGTKIENATGSAFDDELIGNALGNVLDGGAGQDVMIGGAGNDVYVVDNVNDVVVETSTSLTEIDTVMSSINYTLGSTSNLENLTLTGSDNLDGTGNALSNRLAGNAGNNTLDGSLGADVMIGGSGNDTYIVDNIKDAVTETSTLASEIDTVRSSISWTLGANLENLTLTGSDNLTGIGNALNNVLTGNNGNNILNGAAGLDTLIGGAGNDTYVLDQAGELELLQDDVDQGSDLLYINYTSTLAGSTVDLSQSNLQNVEDVTVTGLGNFTVIGNDLNNILIGNNYDNTLLGGAGNDWLDGWAGADKLNGGSGDDTYVMFNNGVQVTELADEGHDLIKTAVSHSLEANVEDGELLGSAALSLTGNELDNSLTGNAAANILDGRGGADTLDGGAGNDTYYVDNIGDTVIERGTSLSEIDTVASSISYTLGSNVENLTLINFDDLNATGNALNNRLVGNYGDNTLDGGLGADVMIDDRGSDTYIVDNLKDVVIETGFSLWDIDTVRSSVSWTLGANLENLTLTGSDNLNGLGNALNNVLTGNSGNNILNGAAGLDTLIGGAGDDTYVLDQAGELALLQETADQGRDLLNINYTSTPTTSTVDLSQSNLQNVENVTVTGIGAFTVIGNDLNNTLQGNAYVNTLQGGAGDDWLDGGAGGDTLVGGSGDDTYIIDNDADKITELAGEGRDQIRTTVSYILSANVEDGVLLGTAALNMIGNELDNSLTGNAAANTLNGGAGQDLMTGGAGNDVYVVDNVNDVVVETSTSLTEIDTVLSSISYTLGSTSNLEYLTLTGGDNLDGTGNALSNRLIGNSGNNVLDGGSGADVMIGGFGNDTYSVDNLKDVVAETSTLASEIDTVRSSVSWTLGANLENLTLTGSDNLNGLGNALNNVLTGNGGNNILNGAAGLDTLIGGAGDDTYVLDQAGELALLQETADQGRDLLNISYTSTPTTSTVDLSQSNLQNVENVTVTGLGAFTVIGNDLNNTLQGNAYVNTLQGGAGDDWLDGGAGGDTLVGGSGDDTYIIDNDADKITELAGEGRDQIRTTVSYILSANVEDGVLLGTAALNMIGNELDNSLTGNAAANTLNGGAGQDLMTGGAGNDVYVVDNVNDVVVETSTSLIEIDTVLSSISYTLGSNVENLTLTGNDNLTGIGNALNNVLIGNNGNNVLEGGSGVDVMIGGFGNDTYSVDNLKDVVAETSTLASEIDTVRSSVSWTLGANLENLTLTGSDNLNGLGNALNNVLTGNGGNNILNGAAGLDTLIGGAGDDTYVLDQAGELALLQETADQGRDLLNISYTSTPITSTVDLSQSNLQNVENVTVTGIGAFTVIGNDLNNTLQGNAYVNTLQGGAGDDWLDGGAGGDTLVGGSGDDTYIIDNDADKITELTGEGRDQIRTTVSYILSANVEDGVLLGTAALNMIGNELDNSLTGNAAANTLNGGAGADTLDGGAGNDTYLVDNVGDTVIERGTSLSEIDTVASSISYTLGSNVENLTLTGNDNLTGIGNALNNVLIGNNGNNTLDGSLGADVMIGGFGNDTYSVDNLKDVVAETSTLASEIDTVRSSVSWTLGANLENLTLTGSDNLNGLGNALNNVLTGNSGNNILNGAAGLDTMIGGAGDDTYVLDQAGELALLQETADQGRDLLNINYTSTPTTSTVDLSQSNLQNVENITVTGIGAFTVIGNDLNNTLQGNAYVNTLQGGAGDDWLDGGAGGDTLVGGSGDDTYIIDNDADKITELTGEGHDQIRTTVSYILSANVEDGVLLGTAALNMIGNELDNSLTGNAAANTLNGGSGQDLMTGGAGNDVYVVDNVNDVVVETSTSLTEIDTVLSSISYTLGSNVENLTLTGNDNLTGIGNALNNVLIGNNGNNVLEGGSGVDVMIGGFGNDTYVVDNLKDVVAETSTLISEVDTVRSSVSWTLGANLENLTLTGSDNLNGLGNALNNVLTGNSGNNILNGAAGLDTLIGGAGDDTYVLDQAGELALLQETADQGRDLLNISYTSTPITSTVDLSQSNLQNVENVTVTGIGAFTVIGNDLNNTLQGNAYVNTLQGGAGDDWLDGGAGGDTLVGGSGDDTYIIDNDADKITELTGEGRDQIRTTVSYILSANVEDGVLLGTAALNMIGNELDNSLTGNAAANTLNGGAGADTLDGGAGNDTYLVDNVGDTVIERGTSLTEIDTVASSISYTLGSNVENLTLMGNDNLTGIGNALNNVLIGNNGNNVLEGGSGADVMIGGSGNDTYVVDNLKDVVAETSTLISEVDTVRSSISWTLGANLENLTLTGSDNLNGLGNTQNNTLLGNAGNNILNGAAGLDTMIGGAGDDTYVLDQAGELALLQETADQGRDLLNINYTSTPTTSTVDLSQSNLQNVENVTVTGIGAFTVIGNDLNNTLQGNAYVNTLQGGAGDDWLDGGAGGDTLVGGSGDDTYIIDNDADKITELTGEGRDQIRTTVSYILSANVEDGVLLGTAALNMIGNELDNSLTGNAAANTLNGGAGADTLDGGAGNDTYLVDNVGDTVIERGTSLSEIDTVASSISYTLGSNVENLTLTGNDNLTGIGNALNNVLIGNNGNNTLDGSLGADVMIGGFGNDTYSVDNLKDVVAETSTLASEIDTVRSSVSWTLGPTWKTSPSPAATTSTASAMP
ncbi:M10 family metallopeptidase C-terminal domain-containing protein [Pseudomonas sp. P9_31]|uniref:M10 family metallopeptidase C-terminal domain-containing protein n=1 Tax=Pseudomonas sp. P9_31 TaxID=3043448 RepID=UPI002A35CCCD|nr:M10 family metallopeptidase C-terminal domain-containing protein [Pseudomonas sp. P9_31]WPN59018.1 M10 family metallopeptidase C-terminal domain-containing protein [Pseudomonas sp. P9_31]